MYAIDVADLLGAARILLNTIVFILERNPMNALNVGRPLIRTHTSLVTREFPLKRNPLNVAAVGRPSVGAQLFLNIGNVTLERNLGNVRESSNRTYSNRQQKPSECMKSLVDTTSYCTIGDFY